MTKVERTSEDIKAVRELLANLQAGPPPSLPELRARYDGVSALFPVPSTVTVGRQTSSPGPVTSRAADQVLPENARSRTRSPCFVGTSESNSFLDAALVR